MMNISVKSVHFHADEKLLNYVDQKLSRLNRYFDRAVEAEVHLKLQDTGGPVHEKIAEVKIHVPGGWMMDKRSGRTFEAAITASTDALKRQLTRYKERMNERGPGIKGARVITPEEVD
ncbi:MAG: ribosome-associated translation inhibitor RaiA [Saprospiraceae bacterium]